MVDSNSNHEKTASAIQRFSSTASSPNLRYTVNKVASNLQPCKTDFALRPHTQSLASLDGKRRIIIAQTTAGARAGADEADQTLSPSLCLIRSHLKGSDDLRTTRAQNKHNSALGKYHPASIILSFRRGVSHLKYVCLVDALKRGSSLYYQALLLLHSDFSATSTSVFPDLSIFAFSTSCPVVSFPAAFSLFALLNEDASSATMIHAAMHPQLCAPLILQCLSVFICVHVNMQFLTDSTVPTLPQPSRCRSPSSPFVSFPATSSVFQCCPSLTALGK